MSRLRYTASCCILIYISSCNLKKKYIYLINNILSSELCICYRVTASSQQRAWGAPHNHLLRWTLVINFMKYTISFISFVSTRWMLNVWTHAIPTISDCTFQLVFTLCYFTEMKHCDVFYCFFQLLWYISPNISEGHRSWKNAFSETAHACRKTL